MFKYIEKGINIAAAIIVAGFVWEAAKEVAKKEVRKEMEEESNKSEEPSFTVKREGEKLRIHVVR